MLNAKGYSQALGAGNSKIKPVYERHYKSITLIDYGYTLYSYIFYFPSLNPPCVSSKLFGSKRMVRERDTSFLFSNPFAGGKQSSKVDSWGKIKA